MLLAAGADARHDEGGRRSVVEGVARNTAVPVEERVRMLQALRAAGADLDHATEWATPLFSAAMNADDDAVEALLVAGADPSREPNGLQGVCFSAITGPHPGVDRVIALLVAAGLDPDEPDEHGLRPLHAALAPDAYGPGYAESDGFNEPAALALIRYGVSLDIEYPETGFRPLHAAAAASCSTVLVALLQAGASPIETSADGRTPLDVARHSGALACVELLTRAVVPGS
jgi:ankyrin repeat protein